MISPVFLTLTLYLPFGKDVSVRSSNVSCSDSWIRRARPRTGESYFDSAAAVVVGEDVDGDVKRSEGGTEEEGGISRMHTAAEFELPEPRRMASRPVDWMVEIKVEGGEVEVMVTRREGIEKEVEEMPSIFERADLISLTQLSHFRGTEKVAS